MPSPNTPDPSADRPAFSVERVRELLGVCERATQGPVSVTEDDWGNHITLLDSDCNPICEVTTIGDEEMKRARNDFARLESTYSPTTGYASSLREVLRLRTGMEAAAKGICWRCKSRGVPERDALGNWVHTLTDADRLHYVDEAEKYCRAGPIWDVLRPREEGGGNEG